MNRHSGQSLFKIASQGDVRRLAQALDAGADISEKSIEGQTLLHETAAKGHLKASRLLLERGIDVDGRNNDEVTPLMVAAHQGKLSIIKLLIENGAGIEGTAAEGETPVLFAAYGGHEDAVHLLREAGADMNKRDANGNTISTYAQMSGISIGTKFEECSNCDAKMDADYVYWYCENCGQINSSLLVKHFLITLGALAVGFALLNFSDGGLLEIVGYGMTIIGIWRFFQGVFVLDDARGTKRNFRNKKSGTQK